MPNFFLIGGKKCGTTSLFRQLATHPEVGFPHKEIHFFTYQGTKKERPPTVVKDERAYRALFAPLADHAVRGDASPSYLHIPVAAERLREAVPDARIVAVLRHPVDRMYSDYLHEARAGREPAASFEEAIAAEGRPGGQEYSSKSRYAEHVARYRSLFPDEQLRFLLYDDYAADPVSFVQGIFRFLGVDDTHRPPAPGQRTKRSGVARSRTLERVVASARQRRPARRLLPDRFHARVSYGIYNANTSRPAFDPATRRRLLRRFEDDVEAVEAVTGRRLPEWRR